MSVLVDSSAWVAHFRGDEGVGPIGDLIDEDLIVTNDLVLTEIVPSLLFNKQRDLAALLAEIPKIPLRLDWDEIRRYQLTCLQNGINKVGIPDLIIVQQAIQNNVALFSLDKHFRLIAQHVPLNLCRELA